MNIRTRLAAAAAGIAMLLPAAGAVPVYAEEANAGQLQDYIEVMVSMVNDARVAEGLNEVYIAPVLNDYAQIRANELPQRFSHDRPDGTGCFSVMKNDGFFYNFAAENIAAGNMSPAATFEQYMNSANHRKNILAVDMTHIGVGYCFDPTAAPEPDQTVFTYYWSMFLIGSYDAFSTPVSYEGQYIPVRETGDADGSKQIDAGDATRIMQYSAKRSAGGDPQVTDAFVKAADVNSDGKINAVDASIVLRFSSERGADPDVQLSDYIWK